MSVSLESWHNFKINPSLGTIKSKEEASSVGHYLLEKASYLHTRGQCLRLSERSLIQDKIDTIHAFFVKNRAFLNPDLIAPYCTGASSAAASSRKEWTVSRKGMEFLLRLIGRDDETNHLVQDCILKRQAVLSRRMRLIEQDPSLSPGEKVSKLIKTHRKAREIIDILDHVEGKGNAWCRVCKVEHRKIEKIFASLRAAKEEDCDQEESASASVPMARKRGRAEEDQDRSGLCLRMMTRRGVERLAASSFSGEVSVETDAEETGMPKRSSSRKSAAASSFMGDRVGEDDIDASTRRRSLRDRDDDSRSGLSAAESRMERASRREGRSRKSAMSASSASGKDVSRSSADARAVAIEIAERRGLLLPHKMTEVRDLLTSRAFDKVLPFSLPHLTPSVRNREEYEKFVRELEPLPELFIPSMGEYEAAMSSPIPLPASMYVARIDAIGSDGLFATRRLPSRTLIGCYSGEFVKRRTGADAGYIYNLESSPFCADALRAGNFTRFINHGGSSGNLEAIAYEHEGKIVLALITTEEVAEGSQLLLDYGSYYDWSGVPGGRPFALTPEMFVWNAEEGKVVEGKRKRIPGFPFSLLGKDY